MRFLLAAVAATTALLAIAPSYAGPNETAFLNRLAGTFSGNGRLSGGENGPISCKLVLKPNAGKLNYTGRCTVQDLGGQGFSGSVTYNDATKHYEARSAAGTVIGVRRGSSLVFTTKSTRMGGSTYSTMSISPSRITIDFTLVRQGEKTTSHVTFSK
ncbi:MAG: hypothetical protein ABI697_06600 [Devosia sp.]